MLDKDISGCVKGLVPDIHDFISDRNLRGRLVYGHYHDKKDINERPMTKFKQDLWEQAVRDIGQIKLP